MCSESVAGVWFGFAEIVFVVCLPGGAPRGPGLRWRKRRKDGVRASRVALAYVNVSDVRTT